MSLYGGVTFTPITKQRSGKPVSWHLIRCLLINSFLRRTALSSGRVGSFWKNAADDLAQSGKSPDLQSLGDVRVGSRLFENSDPQLARRISISISSISESIALAASFGRRQLRKQFCASVAQGDPRQHVRFVPTGVIVDCAQVAARLTATHASAMPRLPVGRIECIQLTIFVEFANKLVIDEINHRYIQHARVMDRDHSLHFCQWRQ